MPISPAFSENKHHIERRDIHTSNTQAPHSHSSYQAPFSGAGSRGQVEQCADRAIKSFFRPDKAAIKHELSMCNEYLQASGNPGQYAYKEGETRLNMPFIEGDLPTQQEVKDAVQELFNLGFMMADPCPKNFIKTPQGKTVPVDFGLFFKRFPLSKTDPKVMSDIVHDYAKGGFRCIPPELKADYREAVNTLSMQLGNDSPLRRMNMRHLMRADLL